MKSSNKKSALKKKFFAGDFGLVYNFDDPNNRYQNFLSQGRGTFKRLIENILLYDEIVIPTQDFLSLSVLVGVLGEEEVIELLHHKSISFLRAKGALAYIGNGGGIQSFVIAAQPNKNFDPFCAPMDEAISWALNGLSIKPKQKELPQLVAEATTEFEVSKVAKEVKHETYQDILNSPHLRSSFAIRNTNMDRLAGVEPNGVRIFGGKNSTWRGDEIDIVMSLANTNLELRIMEAVQADDAITDTSIRSLLEAKADRTLKRPSDESFTELKTISDLPDIGESVLQKHTSLHKLISLSDSKSGKQFKEWFHINCRKDTVTTAKEYSNLLKHIPTIQNLPLRTIRFLITNVVGFVPIVGPAIGVGASTLDSFFIDRLLKGSSPKFFLEQLEKLKD
jgi:hypothetical protein